MAMTTSLVRGAWAQVPARSFLTLSQTLKTQSHVDIIRTNGEHVEGILVGIRPTAIDVTPLFLGGKRRGSVPISFSEDSVQRIIDHDGTWNGKLIGVAVAVGAATLMSASPHERTRELTPYALLLFTPIGSAIGKIIDESRGRLLYIHPGAQLTGAAIHNPRSIGVFARAVVEW
jgi:hypothetical protein